MVITNEQIIKGICNIIDVKTYLRKDEGGRFYGELYADYRNELEESTIRKIFEDDKPREKFYEIMNSSFLNSDGYEHQEVIEIIRKHFDDEISDEEDKNFFNEHEDFIRNWAHENIYFNYPYDHYLNQDVHLDLILDCGDGNYDYTLNELFGCNYSQRGYEGKEHSSLVWLMKQQGYSIEQIIDFIENNNNHGSKFLESVRQECMNTSTCINALTFLVKVSLREALELNELVNSIRFTEKGYEKNREEQEARQGCIVINKETSCGLYDAWSGAGSVLEIEPEKDIEIPLKFVDSILPDGCRGYSVRNIYGVCGSLWSDNAVTVKGAVAA